jgi:RNA polymerase sigma factor for flagellar operon FliA
MPAVFDKFELGRNSKGEQGMMWKIYFRTRDITLRNDLVIQNLGLVWAIARKFKNLHGLPLDLDDLVQYGIFGLIDAVERFDPNLGYSFSTFASPRIHGSIQDELRKLDWVPRTTREKISRVKDLLNQIEQEPNYSVFDITSDLGLSFQEYHIMSNSHMVSLALVNI